MKSSASERVLNVAEIYLPLEFLQRAKKGFDLRLTFWILIESVKRGSLELKKVLQSVATFQVKNADFLAIFRETRKFT